jgi:hypothetical protein
LAKFLPKAGRDKRKVPWNNCLKEFLAPLAEPEQVAAPLKTQKSAKTVS